jgi:hypothetical protein
MRQQSMQWIEMPRKNEKQQSFFELLFLSAALLYLLLYAT